MIEGELYNRGSLWLFSQFIAKLVSREQVAPAPFRSGRMSIVRLTLTPTLGIALKKEDLLLPILV